MFLIFLLELFKAEYLLLAHSNIILHFLGILKEGYPYFIFKTLDIKTLHSW